TGTGTIIGNATGTTTDATNKEYEVSDGTYSVVETMPDGWAQVGNACASVVVQAGETGICTITNVKLGTITIVKVVVNDNGGTATSSDFTVHLHQAPSMVDVPGSPQPGSASGTVYSNLATSTYHVAENATTTYTTSFSGDCNSDGTMELAAGESKSCTVTNDDNPPVVTGKLLINEVLYDLLNGGSQGSENENEWVEIFNGTNATIDLSGYMLHDNSSASSTIPSGTILGSGKYLVVTGSTTTASFWSIPGDAIVIVDSSGTIGNGLANGGDNVLLMAADDTIVDAVSWESDTSSFAPSVPAALDGYSIVRTSPTTDTDTAADWTQTATPTPGATS
ncbi:lamin tail domain-containing protein, partial [Candidatus Kaiserbacteria bacterium]|nr:lamin tail domain-containing protein [Candidatus Kaiserbacteria bacterium]